MDSDSFLPYCEGRQASSSSISCRSKVDVIRNSSSSISGSTAKRDVVVVVVSILDLHAAIIELEKASAVFDPESLLIDRVKSRREHVVVFIMVAWDGSKALPVQYFESRMLCDVSI